MQTPIAREKNIYIYEMAARWLLCYFVHVCPVESTHLRFWNSRVFSFDGHDTTASEACRTKAPGTQLRTELITATAAYDRRVSRRANWCSDFPGTNRADSDASSANRGRHRRPARHHGRHEVQLCLRTYSRDLVLQITPSSRRRKCDEKHFSGGL